MPRVFVPQLPSIKGRPADITDAQRYGDLVVVFGSQMGEDIYPDDADEKMPTMQRHAWDILASFDPDKDFLALTGSPLLIALCVWALVGCDKVRLLRYDRLEHMYYQVTMTDIEEKTTNDQGKVEHHPF